MLDGATHRLVDVTSELLASPRICIATVTWHEADDPCTALELGQRVPVRTPPLESTTSMVKDSPVKARRARTYAESRDAGTGTVARLSGPATRPVQADVSRRQSPTDCDAESVIRTLDSEWRQLVFAKQYRGLIVTPSQPCHDLVMSGIPL
jgi:hypothetical protein